MSASAARNCATPSASSNCASNHPSSGSITQSTVTCTDTISLPITTSFMRDLLYVRTPSGAKAHRDVATVVAVWRPPPHIPRSASTLGRWHASADCRTSALEHRSVSLKNESRTGGDQYRIELERQLGRVDAGFEFVGFHRLAGKPLQKVGPIALLRGDCIAHRARPCADISGRHCEEASAGKHSPLDVGQKRVAGGVQAPDAPRRIEGGHEHLGDEGLPCRRDGRQLKVLFRAEMSIETALAHPDRGGEPADGQAVETVDRRKPRGFREDRLPRALPLRLLFHALDHKGTIVLFLSDQKSTIVRLLG